MFAVINHHFGILSENSKCKRFAAGVGFVFEQGNFQALRGLA